MSSSRVITIAGSIDFEAFENFSLALFKLEQKSDEKVVIEVASDGGDAIAALAICARMRQSTCHIDTVCYGQASSAASMILAYGDNRTMTKEAWVMVHEDSDEVTGDVVNMEVEVAQKRRLEKQWCMLMAARTKLNANQWERLNKKTTYLSAEQCLKVGIVDRIV